MATGFERAQENTRFVSLALEASLYLKGRGHGLTLDELAAVGLRLNFRRGGISDAVKSLGPQLRRSGERICLSFGAWEFLSFALGTFTPSDYRPSHADLDFPIQYLLGLEDERGADATYASRDEIIREARSNDLSVDVAVEILLLSSRLEPDPRHGGALRLTEPARLFGLPSTQFQNRSHARDDMPAIYEGVKAVIALRDRPAATPAAPMKEVPVSEPKRADASEAPKRTTEVRLFVSHAGVDESLAGAFVGLVDGVLTVPRPDWIRCTSVPGHGLEPGDNTPRRLRGELHDADVVLGLLTPASLSSGYVLMELGAGWGFERRVVPLLAGVPFDKIPGPIGKVVHAVRATEENDVASVLDSIAKRCSMPWRVEQERRQALIKQFVERAREYVAKLRSAPSPAATAASVNVPDIPFDQRKLGI